jgi:hypothetical protein
VIAAYDGNNLDKAPRIFERAIKRRPRVRDRRSAPAQLLQGVPLEVAQQLSRTLAGISTAAQLTGTMPEIVTRPN